MSLQISLEKRGGGDIRLWNRNSAPLWMHLRMKPGLHCQSPQASSHQPEAIIPSPHGGWGPTGEWPANLMGDKDGG